MQFLPFVHSRLVNLTCQAEKTPQVERPETVDQPVVCNFIVVASSEIRSVVLVISTILRYLKKQII